MESKSITYIGVNADNSSYTVEFSDDTHRSYKVQYTAAGRRYIKVYGKIIYDYNGKAI